MKKRTPTFVLSIVVAMAFEACGNDGKMVGAYRLSVLGGMKPSPGFVMWGVELKMPAKFAPL